MTRMCVDGYYRGSLWKTIMIVAATTLIMEAYRCTELQQIPGSELDDDDGGGAPDYIWLPVSDACFSFSP